MKYFALITLCWVMNYFSVVAQLHEKKDNDLMSYFQKASFPYTIKGKELEKLFVDQENAPKGYQEIDQTTAKKYFTKADSAHYLQYFIEHGVKDTTGPEGDLTSEIHIYAKDILVKNDKGTAVVLVIEQMGPPMCGSSSSVEAWLVCFDAQQKMKSGMKLLAGVAGGADAPYWFSEVNDLEILQTGEITINTNTENGEMDKKTKKTKKKSKDNLNKWL